MHNTESSKSNSPYTDTSFKASVNEVSPHLYFEKMNYMLLFSELVGNEEMPDCDLFPEYEYNEEEEAKKLHFLETLHRKLSSDSSGSPNKHRLYTKKKLNMKDQFCRFWEAKANDNQMKDLVFQLKTKVFVSN